MTGFGTILTACPIVKDVVMNLWQRVTVAGENRMIPFQTRILWLQNSEAEIILKHGNAVIAKEGTFNDYYGYLTSLVEAIDSVSATARRYNIVRGSALHLAVTVTILQHPVLPNDSPDAQRMNADPKLRNLYLSIPTNVRDGAPWYTSDVPDGDSRYPRLESLVLVERPDIYTTFMGVGAGVPTEVQAWVKQQREVAVEAAQRLSFTKGGLQ